MEQEKAYKSFSVRVVTPDGTMFVHITEDEQGVPQWVSINIGKAGTNLSAWADACARLVSRLLPNVHIAIEELTGITSSRFRQMATGEMIRSGPEGIAYALLKYRGAKYKEEADKLRIRRRDSGAASVGE
jgi:hypothetical protein